MRFEHGFPFFLRHRGFLNNFVKLYVEFFNKKNYLSEQIGLAVLSIELQIVKMFKLDFRFFPKPKVTYDVIKFIKTQGHLKVLALIFII